MKYEYRVERVPMTWEYYEEHAAAITKIAEEGWRLVAVDNGVHYFEREIECGTSLNVESA